MSNQASKPGFFVLQSIASLAILAVSLGGAYWLYSMRKPPADRKNTNLIPEVATYEVSEYRGQLDLVVNGMVVPYREIKVAAEVAGRIAEKSKDFQAGNYVRQGTLLINIDPSDYEIDVRRLQAEVKQAEQMLAETEQDLSARTIDWRFLSENSP